MAVKELVHDPMFLLQKSVPAADCAEDEMEAEYRENMRPYESNY